MIFIQNHVLFIIHAYILSLYYSIRLLYCIFWEFDVSSGKQIVLVVVHFTLSHCYAAIGV